MAEGKVCPLTYVTEKGAYDQEVSDYGCYCVKEKCELWIDNPIVEKPMCAFKAIPFSLFYLSRGIQTIVEKP